MLSVQRGQENEAPKVVQRYCPTTKVACHWCRSKTRQSLRASIDRAADGGRLLTETPPAAVGTSAAPVPPAPAAGDVRRAVVAHRSPRSVDGSRRTPPPVLRHPGARASTARSTSASRHRSTDGCTHPGRG